MEEEKKKLEYEELLRRAKIQFADVPACLMENVIKDWMDRPDYYEKIYNGDIEIGPAKVRDTQDDVNKMNSVSIDECGFYESNVSIQ